MISPPCGPPFDYLLTAQYTAYPFQCYLALVPTTAYTACPFDPVFLYTSHRLPHRPLIRCLFFPHRLQGHVSSMADKMTNIGKKRWTWRIWFGCSGNKITAPTPQSAPPQSAPQPPLGRSAPIDVPGAKARQASQIAAEEEVHIHNTVPAHPDTRHFLQPRLSYPPLDTTKISYSVRKLAVTAPTPVARLVVTGPDLAQDILDRTSRTPPKALVFFSDMSVILCTGELS